MGRDLYSKLVNAHEYFANPFLGNYDDMWLHEGFASYMQPLFGKYLHGDMDYYSMLMNQRAGILNEQPLVTGRERAEQEVYADHSTGPTGDVYGKGSLILHTLRELIGDEAFYIGAPKTQHLPPVPASVKADSGDARMSAGRVSLHPIDRHTQPCGYFARPEQAIGDSRKCERCHLLDLERTALMSANSE